MKIRIAVVFIIAVFSACSNNERNGTTSENDLDAARNFIDAALKGQWKLARQFMVADSTNVQLLDAYENNYRQHMSLADKRGYHEASINFYDTRSISDTISIVSYSNSYMKKRDSLKVVRLNGQWQVDLKYSFPQTDTSRHAY